MRAIYARGHKPAPAVGQWWIFGREEGVIKRILPGGGGDQGIAEFNGLIPATHVSTMLYFDSWGYMPDGATAKGLPAPCTCVDIGGGVVISDGCALHSGEAAKAVEPIRYEGRKVAAMIDGQEFTGWVFDKPGSRP